MRAPQQSIVARLAALPEDERAELARTLPDEQVAAILRGDWTLFARPDQIAPGGTWSTWLMLGGRGGGKTLGGAQWVTDAVANGVRHIALIAETPRDARNVMIEGRSGLLACARPDNAAHYNPSKRLVWWANGAQAYIFSSHEPDDLRGPEFEIAWCDELAKYHAPAELWSNLKLAMRVGPQPRVVVTTTPRGLPIIRDLIDDPMCVVTRCTTYDNAENLPDAFIAEIEERYAGTRLWRQEVMAEVLMDVEGALWNDDTIAPHRIKPNTQVALTAIAVGVDPAASSGERAAETGIVVVGRDDRTPAHYYVLADHSMRGTPHEWGSAVVRAYRDHRADRVIGETNNGGEMVAHTLHTIDIDLPFRAVHASRGKRTRAEPVSALYEQGRVHHIGTHADLEDQMCTWVPDEPGSASPDRVDALVWGITYLMAGKKVRSPSPNAMHGGLERANPFTSLENATWIP